MAEQREQQKLFLTPKARKLLREEAIRTERDMSSVAEELIVENLPREED